jgi:hypothetical protein
MITNFDNFTIETTIVHIGCYDTTVTNNSDFVETVSNVIRQMEENEMHISTIHDDVAISINDDILRELFGEFLPPDVTKCTEMMSIKKLGPYKRVTKNDKLLENECSICLNCYKEKQGQRTLLCGHTFHKSCVDKWFHEGTQTCPICRSSPF